MAYVKTNPPASTPVNVGWPTLLANFAALETAIDQDHDFTTGGTQTGKHNKVTLIEAADIGTGAAGVPILGAQTAGGKAELVFTDEDDNDVQITTAGKIRGASLDNTVSDAYTAADAVVTAAVTAAYQAADTAAVAEAEAYADAGDVVVAAGVDSSIAAAVAGSGFLKTTGSGTVVFNTTFAGAYAWQTLDLSAYIGSNTAFVMLEVRAANDSCAVYVKPDTNWGSATVTDHMVSGAGAVQLSTGGTYAYVSMMTSSSGTVLIACSNASVTVQIKLMPFVK